MNKLTVKIKSVYGNELIYPVNEASKVLCEMTGKKTFSMADLQNARKLGFVVEIAVPDLGEDSMQAIYSLVTG